MLRFWRWLGFHVHEWGMWEVDGDLRRKDGSIIGTSQARTCKTCGFTQFNRKYRL